MWYVLGGVCGTSVTNIPSFLSHNVTDYSLSAVDIKEEIKSEGGQNCVFSCIGSACRDGTDSPVVRVHTKAF